MPELAEVHFHASRWKQSEGEAFRLAWVSGEKRCCRDWDRDLGERLLGEAKLISGYTHGKRMLFAFSGGAFVEIHLGMTGSLSVEQPDYKRGRHDHLVLQGKSSILVFRDPRLFGKAALHATCDGELPAWWMELPPQPHEREFTRGRFDELLARRKGSVVKALLLRQDAFPGVGNWMADEILWRTRVRPDRRVASLNETERASLYQETRYVCREALRTIGVDYRNPPESWLFRHRWKAGGICPKTGEVLQRTTVGGRTSCWSAGWQR